MLSKTEQVWRHLVVAASEGNQRRWRSVSAVAVDLGLGVSTVHAALAHPVEIGAVVVRGSGGLRVLDPGRLLLLWAGRRRLGPDTLNRLRVRRSAPEVEQWASTQDVVLGGFGAVVARTGGNTIADYDTVMLYGRPTAEVLPDDADGDGPSCEVIFLEPDHLLPRYGRITPLPQAWVDLFCLPGWQSARFVHQLLPRLITDAVTEQLLPA